MGSQFLAQAGILPCQSGQAIQQVGLAIADGVLHQIDTPEQPPDHGLRLGLAQNLGDLSVRQRFGQLLLDGVVRNVVAAGKAFQQVVDRLIADCADESRQFRRQVRAVKRRGRPHHGGSQRRLRGHGSGGRQYAEQCIFLLRGRFRHRPLAVSTGRIGRRVKLCQDRRLTLMVRL